MEQVEAKKSEPEREINAHRNQSTNNLPRNNPTYIENEQKLEESEKMRK